jgi:glycosyltransferase involved in cell wall biosynthesis
MNPRVLIFIVAYNHENLIEGVLDRIPSALAEYETEILIIDDASSDRTFETAVNYKKEKKPPFGITVLVNPENQRYGGNQKIGFHYAIENGFDALALVHGDGQYAPEALPELLAPILAGEADGVMGSRMATRFGALKGGMPFYKFIGNKILTTYQNFMLGTDLYEFHTGYRLYAVDALKRIPFDLATNEFHYDNEIFIQMHLSGMRVKELPIDTFYGDEVCHVDGFYYAWDLVKTTAMARLHKIGWLYERKFDVEAAELAPGSHYQSKAMFESTHSLVVDYVADGSTVLDIGCAGGHVAALLKAKNCKVTGIDCMPKPENSVFENYIQLDIDREPISEKLDRFDTVLLMDVVEHFSDPDAFTADFSKKARMFPDLNIILSSGNVTFILIRLAVLFGIFNYSKRGILDLTHKRLFTFSTLKRLLEGNGFEITTMRGVPAPFPLALGDNTFSRLLIKINLWLIALSKGLFSYQILIVAKPRPSLRWLLSKTREETHLREVSDDQKPKKLTGSAL